MPKIEVEEWELEVRTGDLPEFYKPPEGQFTVKIVKQIEVVPGFRGKLTKQITVAGPSGTQQAWRTTSFNVFRAIKEFKEKHGEYVGHSFTFSASGSGPDRRYKFVEAR